MDKYIKKQDVISVLSHMRETEDGAEAGVYYAGREDALEEAVAALDDIPNADVAPVVHAHWATVYKRIGKCSHCGRTYGKDDVTDMYFCPSCGAKMNEEVKQ